MDAAQIEQLMRQAASQDPTLAQQATLKVKEISQNPGFVPFLIQIFGQNLNNDFGLWCAITLKSHIMMHWEPNGDVDVLSEQDRQFLRQTLVDMLLQCPSKQKAQIIHAMGIVSLSDYPTKWPSLLPELLSKLSADPKHNTIIFEAIATVLYKYRSTEQSDDITIHLRSVNATVLPPLTAFVETQVTDVVTKLTAIHQGHSCLTTALSGIVHGIDIETLRAQLQCLIWVFEIVISLHSIDISEFAQNNIGRMFNPLFSFLSVPAFNIPCQLPDYEGSAIDAVHALIIEIINLFAGKYEEDFQPLINTAVSTVWTVLLSRDNSQRYDSLMCSCLSFFSSLATKQWYSSYLDDAKLSGLIDKVVVMHTPARSDDIDAVTDDPSYLERELISTGNENISKRGAVLKLVQSLCQYYHKQVVTLVGAQIQHFTAQYAANPKTNWSHIETALLLFVSIGMTPEISQKTVALFPIAEYLGTQVVPLLNQYAQTSPPSPLLVISALKALVTFRTLIPAEAHLGMLQVLFHYIASDEHVIASYSAYCISIFVGNTGVIQPSVTSGIANQLIKQLLSGLKNHEENQYILAAVISTIGAAPQEILPIASELTTTMFTLLRQCMANQTNQRYIYLLFELLAITMRIVIGNSTPESKSRTLDQLEGLLFPAFQEILSNIDLCDIHCYVLTIMAMFLEERSNTIPSSYLSIWPMLSDAELWKTSSNIPALVRFINAFLHNNVFIYGTLDITNPQRISSLLGIYQRLIASPRTYIHAFHLSQGIAAYTDIFAQRLPDILRLHFAQLTAQKNNMHLRAQIVWLYSFWILTDSIHPAVLPTLPELRKQWTTPETLLPSCDAFVKKAITSFQSISYLFAEMNKISPGISNIVMTRVWDQGLTVCESLHDKKLFFRATIVLVKYLQVNNDPKSIESFAEHLKRYTVVLQQSQQALLAASPSPEAYPKTHQIAAAAAHGIENRSTLYTKADVVLRCCVQQIPFDLIDLSALLALIGLQ